MSDLCSGQHSSMWYSVADCHRQAECQTLPSDWRLPSPTPLPMALATTILLCFCQFHFLGFHIQVESHHISLSGLCPLAYRPQGSRVLVQMVGLLAFSWLNSIVCALRLPRPFICWPTLRPLLGRGHRAQCCHEHGCAEVSLSSWFLL